MSSSRSSLQVIISKVGHPIEEIRSRSLDSIIKKLDHGLLRERDLLENDELVVNLMKWFNFPHAPKKEEALKLILRLCDKTPLGCEQLIKLGAVRFFSGLKSDLHEDALEQVVDEIVNKLFMLPDVDTNAVVSSADSPLLSNSTSKNDSDEIPMVNLEMPDNHQCAKKSDQGTEYSGFKLISLPCIYVFKTDLRILYSTNISLESADMHVVSKSIDFLMDVVLKDFPPEVFLQYSQILKHLLSILNMDTQHIYSLPQKAIRCLQTFIKSLCVRVNSTEDVAMYSFKQARNGRSNRSSDSFKSPVLPENLRPRGDGQDGDIHDQSSRLADNLNVDFVEGDRSMEISIPHFCLMIFTNTQQLQQSSVPGVLSVTLELLLLSCELLSLCINDHLWNDSSDLACLLRQQLITSYETLANSILYHHGKCKQDSTKIKIHRLAFCGLVNVWIRILRTSVSVDKFTSVDLPLSCIEGLTVATMDFSIYKHKPHLHIYLRDYLLAIENSEIKLIYSEAIKLTKALRSAVEFLSLTDDRMGSLLQKAEEALYCLYYFRYMEFADAFIEGLSNAFNDCVNFNCEHGYSIIVDFLKYHHIDVRKEFYIKCLDITKICISNCDGQTDTWHSWRKLRIFVNTEVLKQIITCGFEDDSNEIQIAAKEIVALLLTHKSLLPSDLWKDLTDCILPIFPLLLGYSDTSTPLGLAIFNLPNDNADWTTLELIKANVRFLFSKDKKLRAQATPRIAWLLAKDEDALYKVPHLAQLNAAVLPDIFIGVKPPNICFEVEDSLFQNIGLLLRLFHSSDGDVETRKRAGIHLANALSDEALCNQFKSLKGPQQIVGLLHTAVSTENLASGQIQEDIFDLLPVTLEILWKSMMRNIEFVNDWSTESMFYTLLRVAILRHSDQLIISFISSILAFMLFRELFQSSLKGNELSISIEYPAIFHKFELPLSQVKICVDELPALLHHKVTRNEVLDSFMKFVWCDATGKSLEGFQLTSSEVQMDKITAESTTGEDSLIEISKATSHKPVIFALKMLHLEILSDYNKVNCNLNLDLFHSAFDRYVATPPKSNADKSLLKSILQFFTFSLNWCPILTEKVVEKLYKMLLLPNGAFQHCMIISNDLFQCDVSENNRSYSPVTKEVLNLSIMLLSKSSYLKEPGYKVDLTASLPIFVTFGLQHLKLTDAPQFYNLASLEATLHCLIHITARPKFSVGLTNESPLNICRQLINLLMEVVAAFHLSRESNQHSYMGRGVTLAATICLSQIAREMTVVSEDDEWVKFWLFNYDSQDETRPQLGFSWVIPLWTHSDVEIRAASMDIMSSFTSTKTGCKIVLSHIHQLAGGLWGVALTFLLDHTEACIVRQQAAVVLTNLTAHILRGDIGQNSGMGDAWHGPIIADPELQVPLVGLPALLLLLQRSNFMREMAVLLSNFYFYSTLSSNLCLPKKSLNSESLKLNDDLSVFEFTSDICASSLGTNDTSQEWATNTSNEMKLQSLTTCSLVKTVCQFMKNLVILSPREIMLSMKTARIFEQFGIILETCRSALQNSDAHKLGSNISTFDVVDLLKVLLDLLATSCQNERSLCLNIINNHLLGSFFSLLDVQFKGIPEVTRMWNSLYTVLVIVSMNVSNEERNSIINNVFEKIPVIIGNFEMVLSCKQFWEVKQASLIWLVQFLSTNSLLEKRELGTSARLKNIKDIFDCNDARLADRKAGCVLSSLLLPLLQEISHNPKSRDGLEMMSLVVNTYTALLAVSLSGKEAALENGLIPLLLDRKKQIFEHVHYLSTEDKPPKMTKNNEALFTNLVCIWNLLKNLLHENLEAKNLASEHNLCSTLLLFWDLAVSERNRLLPAYLSLICTYIANCPKAGKCLCVPSAITGRGTSSSLLSEVLKFCHQELIWMGKHSNTENLELAFTILATVCFTPIGCSTIVKSKILQCYTSSTQTKAITPQQETISPWWLKLFTNMTFSKEGREAVINLPGIIEILVIMLSRETNERMGAMKIIRNLCFLPAKKSKLLSSNELLTMITSQAVNATGSRLQLLAASGLWALLANNRKAKSILKSDAFIHRVQDIASEMNQSSQVSEDRSRILEILESILEILRGGFKITSAETNAEETTDVSEQ